MPTQQNAYITKCLHYKMPNNKLIFDFDSRTDGSTVYLAGETWGQHRKQRLHVYKHTYSLWIHEIAGIAIKNLWKYSCKNVSSCHIKQRKASIIDENNYKYVENGGSTTSNYWRCSKRECKATIVTSKSSESLIGLCMATQSKLWRGQHKKQGRKL